MNTKFLNRSTNPARCLILAVGLNLAMLLLATTGQAAIAIQDGSSLTYTYTASASINKSFTVTTGASVLVVLVEDRSVNNAEPGTINWLGGQTLTRDVQSSGIPSTTRGLAIYHLYNPIVGTTNLIATVTGASGNWVTAYTLSGVDTTITPIAGGATSGGTSTTTSNLTINVTGVPAGAWAAVNACFGAGTPLSVYLNATNQAGATISSTTVSDAADNGTTAIAGYVPNLSAGTNIFASGTPAPGSKFVSAVVVFSPPSPPSMVTQPQSVVIFTNGIAKFSATATGTAPLFYQWYTNSTTTALGNTANRTGTTTNVLTISNAGLTDVANYTLVVTNAFGAVTSSVANILFTSPNGAYERAVMTNGVSPFALYTFSETNNNPSSGTVVAQDSVGGFNGIYGAATTNGFTGIAGPRATADALIGFPDTNTAVLTVANAANSFVTLPAFNLNSGGGTNVLTITAWVKPQTVQANNVGIVFCRSGTTVSGLDYNSVNGHLGYTWNNESGTYGWDSGITPPTNVWSLVALVVTPTNNTVYILNTNGLLSSTHVYTHVVQKFDGTTLAGLDNNNVNRTFNGSIDEVALFGQALTQSQLTSLFSAASGVSVFPPSIGANPTWAPASVYVGQTSSVTVSAGGTAPLTYQWMAGVTNSGSYGSLVNGGNIAGVTNATLTITNVQLTNLLDYVVVVSNAYGVITSTVPAKLTVIPPGPATNFTLNFGGTPIQQGLGADWNTVSAWNPLGLPASTAVLANPGSSFQLVVGSRLRNPAATTYNVFPGASLTVSGSGVFENGTVNAVGEIRFKNSNVSSATTNYFNNLVLSGGQLNIGDSTDVILQGTVTVVSNSVLYALGTGTNQTFRIDSYLTGSGTMQLYLSNSTPAAALVITGTTNTFKGQWNIVQGPLMGSGTNSLGTNTITIGTNAALETVYDINNTNSSLILNGQFFLHQNDTFQSMVVSGVSLTRGTYTFAQLNSAYPATFPATWTQKSGSTVNTGSGSITVLSGPSVIALASSAQINGYLGAVTFTAAVQTNGATAGDATGTVIFSTTNGPISTNSISAGSAISASASNLPRGTNIITAIYSGDSNYFGTTNTLSQFVTNHPPVAQPMTVTRPSGMSQKIALSDVATNWSDADADTVTLTSINLVTTNSVNLMTNSSWIFYTNSPNVNDQISYTISDGFGGTSTGLINIVISSNVTGTNSIAQIIGGNPTTVTAYGIPGYQYILERATNLVSAVWVDVSTNAAANNGVINAVDDFTDLGGIPPSSGYYRLRWLP